MFYFAFGCEKADMTIPVAYPHFAGASSKIQSAFLIDLGLTIRRGKDFHTDIGCRRKRLVGRSRQFVEPVQVNPNGVRYADAFGGQNGLLRICTVAGKEGLQERGDAKALFAMERVWWRTHEKMSEGIDLDAFATPEQLRVCQKVIPALQEELGPSVSF